jgi:hypothetical protein
MVTIGKSNKLYFDTLFKAHETNDQQLMLKCRIALQAFFEKPTVVGRKQIQAIMSKIQAFGVSTDFDKLVSDAFNVTIEADNFDLGYERVFKEVPLGTNQDTWDIYNVKNGITFNLIPEGNRIHVDKVSGDVITAHVDYYGGALGWTDKMIRYRKVAAMLDMASLFRNNFYVNKANNFYLLLALAAVGNVTVYQGAVADGQLRRDILTINRAAFNLANRNKNKGYGDTAATQLVLYANPLDKGRINAALASTTAMVAQALSRGEQINWNISVIYTFNSNIVSGRPLLVLPGNKLQRAEDMPPTTFTQPKDILTLNEVQSVWSIYGGAVGDTDQIETVTLG